MASAKKKTGEEKKKSKETKPLKPENKNNTRTKPKTNTKKQKSTNKISNGTVREPELEVEVIPTSSTDSKQEEEEKKTQEAMNQRSNSKSKKSEKSSKKQELDDDEEDKEDARSAIFPMSRMKRIMKSQGFDSLLTREAVFLANKATEKFLQQFCEDAYDCCVKDRKKSVSYKHLDFVPEQIKAVDALAERKLPETGDG